MWKVVTLALLVSSYDYAQPPIYQGTGVVYDEPEQVAQYVRSQEDDGTLAAIDAEKPHACADMKVAFFMGQTGETITTSSGRWQITKILIAGVGRASNRYNLRSRGPLFNLKENRVPAVHLGGPFLWCHKGEKYTSKDE
jgi:hypothetical protein